jgi:flagellar assembly factor FliW
MEMNLANTYNEVKKWCLENSIGIFYGLLDFENDNKVKWEDETRLFDFLNLAKLCSVKMLIVNKFLYDAEENFEIEDIIINIEESGIEFQTIKEIKDRYASLEQKNGEIELLIISWIMEGIVYEYSAFAPFYEENEELKSILEEIKATQTAKTLEEHGKELEQRNAEREEQNLLVSEIAEKLASFPNFYGIRNNRAKLEAILSNLFEEGGYDENSMWKYSIIREANIIFERDYLEEAENDLADKIQEMKQNGTKKIEAKAKLEISDRILNKFWNL